MTIGHYVDLAGLGNSHPDSRRASGHAPRSYDSGCLSHGLAALRGNRWEFAPANLMRAFEPMERSRSIALGK